MKRLLLSLPFIFGLTCAANAQPTYVVVASCPDAGTWNTIGSIVGPNIAVDINGNLCGGGGSGGGGGLSVTDQSSFTAGTSKFTPGGGVFNDSATLSSGQEGTFRLTTKRGVIVDVDSSGSQLHSDLTAAIPAGTNTIGNVNPAPNVTATDCSGTITLGGTAQAAFSAQTTLHGFTIVNIDTTEPLWISFTTTAAASGAGSYPLQAATATTFAGAGSFTTPPGFGLNHALSVVAATTSHKFNCTWW